MNEAYAPVPPRLTQFRRRGRGHLWLLSLVFVACGGVLFFFNPAQHSFYPFCFFYRTTGWLCPGCGCLRASYQLLHGHLLAALRANVLFVASLPVATVLGVRYWRTSREGRPFPWTMSPRLLWFLLLVMAIFTVLRNLPFAPFTYLAP